MNTAKKLTLGLLRGSGAADPTASFTVTTTGAQTLTIQALTVSASTTVDWGDGSSNAYTGSGGRTHNYAGAGTWNVRILEPLNVTELYLSDTKVTTLLGEQIAKLANLTSLTLLDIANTTWTVGATAPLPVGLTTLLIGRLGNNVIWTVGAAAPLPVGLTALTILTLPGVSVVSSLDACLALTTVRIENNLTTAQVNTVLANLWAGFAARTATNGTIDLLGGGNLGPTGPVAAENPPTYGGAYVHELVNDTGNVNPTHKWLSASTATPV